jgi:hypothetical protein
MDIDVLENNLCTRMDSTTMDQSVWTEKKQGLPADWLQRPSDQYKCYVFPASCVPFFFFFYSNLDAMWPSHTRKI